MKLPLQITTIENGYLITQAGETGQNGQVVIPSVTLFAPNSEEVGKLVVGCLDRQAEVTEMQKQVKQEGPKIVQP